MSTAPNGSPAEAVSNNPVEKSEKPQAPAKNEKKPKGESDPSSAPKLSGAELKAKAKAEKAARRAQTKATKEVGKGDAPVSSAAGQSGPPAGDVKANKAKGKQDSVSGASSGPAGKAGASKAATPPTTAEPKITIPECFSHLSIAKKSAMANADKDVHPTVLALGQQMATFAIDESITRLKATLLAFKKVIDSYNTPPGNTLARHLTPHVLNPQIDYLTACRPMCFSMGNAIRWLKLQVSKIDPDVPEQEAKKLLCEGIDSFIQERISVADFVITEAAAGRVVDGDTVLTFGRSTLVENTLLHAHSVQGKKFSVIVIDDPYERKGQTLSKTLAAEGITVSYCGDFGGLRWHAQRASMVLLCAESMFSNGSMYGRSGTCDLAIAAKELELPVTVLCETINITERVATDSLTYNEIDPERCSAASFRLLFDTTLDKYLSVVITELGSVQPTSVPDILRKLEESN